MFKFKIYQGSILLRNITLTIFTEYVVSGGLGCCVTYPGETMVESLSHQGEGAGFHRFCAKYYVKHKEICREECDRDSQCKGFEFRHGDSGFDVYCYVATTADCSNGWEAHGDHVGDLRLYGGWGKWELHKWSSCAGYAHTWCFIKKQSKWRENVDSA